MPKYRKGATFAARIYQILNRPSHAKIQSDAGDYGRRIPISLRNFERHLRDHETIALSAVDAGKAKFLAIDVDNRFEERLPVFSQVLAERCFQKAAFAITGSTPGRGKVVITLAVPLPQRQAITLVLDIAEEAASRPNFGPRLPADLTKFPQSGDGGHVRLFGRNRKRVKMPGALEIPLNLAGELSDLYYVEPTDVQPIARLTWVRPTELSEWAKTFSEQPYNGRTPDLFKAMLRLAYEAVPLYRESATDFLATTFRRIEEQSPDLTASSRRMLHRADTRQRLIKYASVGEKKHYNTSGLLWCPKTNIKAPRSAARVYRALAEYTQENCDPRCFGITFERIADLACYASKSKAREAALRGVDAGLIVRIDRGLQKTKGSAGLCGLYALVGEHSNPRQAFEIAITTSVYKKRSDDRIKRGLDPLPTWEDLCDLPAAA